MATAEARGISPEQQRVYGQIAKFFGRAENDFPAAAKQLVNVVGGLVGDQQTTRRELQAGMGNIDIGLALIGDWLKETGAEGFEVRLGLGGGAKKAIGRSQVKFPNVSDLIRVGGRVDSELQKQIPPLLSSFSRQIRGGLDVGLSPREIVGGLVAESVGSKLSADGSANLRQTLNKPLGGHFEWIREALGIPDAAETPDFAKRVEAPRGYKLLEKDSAAFLEVGRQGTRFYIGRHPADLVCGEDGNYYFRLSEVSWPKNAIHRRWYFKNNNPDDLVSGSRWESVPKNGVPLSHGRNIYLYSRSSSIYQDEIEIINHELSYLESEGEETAILLPDKINLPREVVADFTDIHDEIRILRLTTLDGGKVRIVGAGHTNNISIFVPLSVVVRGGVAREEQAETLDFNRRSEGAKRLAQEARVAERGAKPAETKTEDWEGAVKKLIKDPFAQIAYEQTQSVIAAAAAYGLNAEISNGLVGEEQFIGLVKRIAALSQNMRPKKSQPQLLLQWQAHQRLFLEDEISRTAYEATGSIVAAAAAFSLREEIMAGTIAEEKFVPLVREVATLVQKTRSQIKH